MPPSDTSDSELLSEWLDHGREAAFRVVVDRYAGLVFATARRTSGDHLVAEEAAQHTFIALARQANSLRSCATLGGWLHRTAVFQARNFTRKNRREAKKRQQYLDTMKMNRSDPPVEGWKELQPVLDEALCALSDRDREALLLRFYRAMSIEELAATLCIGTEAAQKRVSRATERLRTKLMHRGCRVGGSLSALMLTGLAGDAQAAVPGVSVFATNAMAVGVASAGGLASSVSLLSAAATKTTSLVPPLVAALVAGVWIMSQRHSLAELERQSADLEKALAAGSGVVSLSSRGVKPVVSALDQVPIDWAEVARQLASTGEWGYLQPGLALKTRLNERLDAMDIGELVASLDEIAAAGLSSGHRNLLDQALGGLLVEKDPELGLNHFIDRFHEEGSSPISWMFAEKFGQWAKRDPKSAVAWFDQQIAAGAFDSRDLNGSQRVRILFENRLVFPLLSSDPEAAGLRLAAFPQDQRRRVLEGVGIGREIRSKPGIHRPFAEMLREQLSEDDRLNVITWPIIDLGETGTIKYSDVDAYFSRIAALSDERKACILAVASEGRFKRESGNIFDTSPGDLDALRAWAGREDLKLLNQVTTGALKRTLNLSDSDFPRWADYAEALHETGGSDEILISVLEAHNAAEHKELSSELARRLTDEAERNRYLKEFE